MRALVGLALLVFALLLVELALRLPFPCDLYLWSESPFMTNMLKLANGLPIYTDPADLNSFVYAPGLEYLTYTLLAPLGLALDIRAARLVNIAVGLAGAACTAAVMTRAGADLGVARRREYSLLAFTTAALVIFANPTAFDPHPDNLQTLHATATLLLCYLALRRASFPLAVAAMAVAGLGVMTKQTAALAFVGAGAALLLGHAWGPRRAAALIATGLAVGGGAIATLLIPPNARFFTVEVLRAQGVEWSRVPGLVADFFQGPRLILGLLAPGCVLHLLRRGGRAGRQLTIAWIALGLAEVAPNVLPSLKFIGGGNSLFIFGAWLLVLVWPALHHAAEEARDRAPIVSTTRWVACVLLVLGAFPTRLPPSESANAYCQRLIESVGADLRANKRVLLEFGTSPFIWNGVTSVPLDRAVTILEVFAGNMMSPSAGLGTATAAMAERLDAGYYDRIYTRAGAYSGVSKILDARYRQVDVLRHAEPWRLPLGTPFRWLLTLEYTWMPDLLVYERK